QEADALERIRGRRDDAPDLRFRRVGAALREPQESEAGLGLGSSAARAAVRVLRLGELSAEAVELGLLVRRRGGRRIRPRREALGRAPRLCDRLGPVAGELQDLRTVDETAAGEGDLRHVRAPGLQRGRPLARTRQGIDLLAALDDGAV